MAALFAVTLVSLGTAHGQAGALERQVGTLHSQLAASQALDGRLTAQLSAQSAQLAAQQGRELVGTWTTVTSGQDVHADDQRRPHGEPQRGQHALLDRLLGDRLARPYRLGLPGRGAAWPKSEGGANSDVADAPSSPSRGGR